MYHCSLVVPQLTVGPQIFSDFLGPQIYTLTTGCLTRSDTGVILSTSLWHDIAAACTIRQPSSCRRTSLPTQHVSPTHLHRAWSVCLELLVRTVSDRLMAAPTVLDVCWRHARHQEIQRVTMHC